MPPQAWKGSLDRDTVEKNLLTESVTPTEQGETARFSIAIESEKQSVNLVTNSVDNVETPRAVADCNVLEESSQVDTIAAIGKKEKYWDTRKSRASVVSEVSPRCRQVSRKEILGCGAVEEDLRTDPVSFTIEREKRFVNFATNSAANVETPKAVAGWNVLEGSPPGVTIAATGKKETYRDTRRSRVSVEERGCEEQYETAV